MALQWKGMTADELLVKREIDRVNRQIREAVKAFGQDSRLYHQYVNTIAPRGLIGFGVDMVRETKEGVIQLSVSKKSIREMMNYSQYQKRLQQLGRLQTVQQAKQQYLKSAELRKGRKAKTRAEKKEFLESAIKRTNVLFGKVSDLWFQYYELERKAGEKFKSHDEIKALSKGYWTTEEDLEKMIQKLETEINAERHEAVKNVLEGY